MWEAVLLFLEENAVVLGGAGGVAGVATLAWAIVKSPFSRNKPTELAPETIAQIKPAQAKDGPALTIPEFIRIRRELKEDLEKELAQADDAEKTQLRARIAELESQIANPNKSLEEAKKRIADLEALLDRSGNDIGGDRIAEAKAALEKGDYSIADDIFAEIEARNQLAVEEAARAAYGRGEVAEAEVRWADAAKHYAQSAKYNATFESLFKASAYARRAGDYPTALRWGEDLLNWTKANGTDQQKSTAMNELALVVQAQGRYEEAEGLYHDVLEIDRATIGDSHPDYATGLNNLALAVKMQGRYEEAEGLYREALEIGRVTIGEAHPEYAARLNNLAAAVQEQGKYEDAERLYREALEIDRATIGEGHPDYAIDLGNLASNLAAQGKAAEARRMLDQVLTIFRAALPEDHPHIAETLLRIAALPDP